MGYAFKNERLLAQALCHRSWANEHANLSPGHNERLEYLGDSVLELIASQLLVRRYPEAGEGWMTKVRAALVRADSLARFARDLELPDHALLGRGEDRNNGREKDRLCANLFEAMLGAIYLDSGIRACERLVKPLLLKRLEEEPPDGREHDFKSRLQELTMRRWGRLPHYHLDKSDGPEHAKEFHISVWMKDHRLGRGHGRSKKTAQQAAARDALALLESGA